MTEMHNRVPAMLLVRQLTRTASAAHAHGDRAAATVGQSLARWQVLDSFTDTPRTVPAAARRLRQSRQSAQRIVDLLTREGLLEAAPNPDHRNSPLYSVTAAGRAMLEDLDRSAAPWQEFLTARLTRQEIETLTELLTKLQVVADDYDDRSA
jgi:DNA-binding MarR family transcriptional regulator